MKLSEMLTVEFVKDAVHGEIAVLTLKDVARTVKDPETGEDVVVKRTALRDQRYIVNPTELDLYEHEIIISKKTAVALARMITAFEKSPETFLGDIEEKVTNEPV